MAPELSVFMSELLAVRPAGRVEPGRSRVTAHNSGAIGATLRGTKPSNVDVLKLPFAAAWEPPRKSSLSEQGNSCVWENSFVSLRLHIRSPAHISKPVKPAPPITVERTLTLLI